jgi:hypothetical protein
MPAHSIGLQPHFVEPVIGRELTVRLKPALGETLVELFHYGFEQAGGEVDTAHAEYEEGWGMLQLKALKVAAEN